MTPSAPEVALRRHPAERKPAPSVVLPQFGCCCSCCCCLHTLGGLIGGIVGSVGTVPQEPKPVDPDFPFPFRRDELENEPDMLPVAGLYWMLVLFVLGCVPLWSAFTTRTSPNAVFEGILIGLFFLPLAQLGASILTLLGVAIFYTDRANALRRLGRITLWSFVGTLIGIGIMAGICGIFMIR